MHTCLSKHPMCLQLHILNCIVIDKPRPLHYDDMDQFETINKRLVQSL